METEYKARLVFNANRLICKECEISFITSPELFNKKTNLCCFCKENKIK